MWLSCVLGAIFSHLLRTRITALRRERFSDLEQAWLSIPTRSGISSMDIFLISELQPIISVLRLRPKVQLRDICGTRPPQRCHHRIILMAHLVDGLILTPTVWRGYTCHSRDRLQIMLCELVYHIFHASVHMAANCVKPARSCAEKVTVLLIFIRVWYRFFGLLALEMGRRLNPIHPTLQKTLSWKHTPLLKF